ncbi:MAG: hypothetical protein WC481_07510 [Candidatus Omnitrophota bacterium]
MDKLMTCLETVSFPYADTWYDRIARKQIHNTGTVKARVLQDDTGRIYYDVKWINASGVVVADGAAPADDRAFDGIRDDIESEARLRAADEKLIRCMW